MDRIVILAAALAALMLAPRLFAQEFAERWNYVGGSCADDAGTEKLIALLKRSREVGCTHVLLNEAKMSRIGEQKPEYFERAKKVLAAAKEMNLQIVPGVCKIGYSGTYFHYDSNLAAGVPVRDMQYVVKGAAAAPDPALALDASKAKFNADGTVTANFDVKPFHNYRVSFFTTGEPGDPEEYVRVTGVDSKRWISRTHPTVKKEGERKSVQVIFNTLEATKIGFRISGGKGKIEDLKIEPAGMLLILRRPLIPLVVTNEDKSVTYVEGEDFKPVSDPIVTVRPFPGEFPIDHGAPNIELTGKSKIQDGQKLLVSFYHHQRIYSDQDCMSLEDPKTFEILEREVADVAKAWPCAGYFLNYDEIRVAGWEPLPGGEKLTPGQLLARHFKRMYDAVKKNAPEAKVYTWSDMFTPHHNARGTGLYYLVNGNWEGSWEGLPKDVIIMNWYAPKPEGIRFFSDRGHQQVLCGFYDGKTPDQMKKNIRHWMDVSKDAPGVLGFMYTTWRKDFDSMPGYFKLVDTYGEWGGKAAADPGKER